MTHPGDRNPTSLAKSFPSTVLVDFSWLSVLHNTTWNQITYRPTSWNPIPYHLLALLVGQVWQWPYCVFFSDSTFNNNPDSELNVSVGATEKKLMVNQRETVWSSEGDVKSREGHERKADQQSFPSNGFFCARNLSSCHTYLWGAAVIIRMAPIPRGILYFCHVWPNMFSILLWNVMIAKRFQDTPVY